MDLVVGVIKQPDSNSQDSVDAGIAGGAQYNVKSKSASDFYQGIKKAHDDCIASKKNDDCCIKHLTVDGHSTAGLGGGEGFDKLTAAQIKDLKSMLCKGATITFLGCRAFNTKKWPQYKTHLSLAMLLTESGGTYEGYGSTTTGLYPNVVSSDPNEKTPTQVSVPAGATEADVQASFDKVDPK